MGRAVRRQQTVAEFVCPQGGSMETWDPWIHGIRVSKQVKTTSHSLLSSVRPPGAVRYVQRSFCPLHAMKSGASFRPGSPNCSICFYGMQLQFSFILTFGSCLKELLQVRILSCE